MRVGIAGYGVVGKTRHLSIEANTSFQVTAISEKNTKAREAINSDVKIYGDYKDLIADADIDVIFRTILTKHVCHVCYKIITYGIAE